MKRYSLFLIILLFFSCNDIFHQNDTKYTDLSKPQEQIDILNGIYGRLVQVYNRDYFTVLARSDDINIYNTSSCSGINSASIDFTGIVDKIYGNLYTAIISANSLIDQLSETHDAAILGEAYFLRGYCYFKLARLFGTPPLITDIDVNYSAKKPTYTEVYQFIVKDFLKAIQLLPDTYADARIPGETPNKGTAKAMLAEVYLAMAGYPVNDKSKYAMAAKLAGEVISHADYYHYALLDDYANLWKSTYRINSETIFGLFFDKNNRETLNNIGGYSISDDNGLFIFGRYVPEFKYFNDFPNNYRKYTSMVTGNYGESIFDLPFGSNYISGLKFNPYNPLLDPCDYMQGGGCVWLKWVDEEDISNHNTFYYYFGSAVTLYLLRYAQTLLTYAEAKARAGELDDSAFEAVNMVRRRANKVNIYSPSKFDLSTSLSPAQFIDSVVWERAWELGGEPDGRWFDIIRLNLKDSLPKYTYSRDYPTQVPSADLTPDWYFYKLPEQDILLDPKLDPADSTK